MCDKHCHDETPVYETLDMPSPNLTTVRLPKGDTLVVEAGGSSITINGEGNISVRNRNDIVITAERTLELRAMKIETLPVSGHGMTDPERHHAAADALNSAPEQNPSAPAFSVCNRTQPQYAAWQEPKQEFTEPASVQETSSTGDEEDNPSS